MKSHPVRVVRRQPAAEVGCQCSAVGLVDGTRDCLSHVLRHIVETFPRPSRRLCFAHRFPLARFTIS
jgi:hypothetical protein